MSSLPKCYSTLTFSKSSSPLQGPDKLCAIWKGIPGDIPVLFLLSVHSDLEVSLRFACNSTNILACTVLSVIGQAHPDSSQESTFLIASSVASIIGPTVFLWQMNTWLHLPFSGPWFHFPAPSSKEQSEQLFYLSQDLEKYIKKLHFMLNEKIQCITL